MIVELAILVISPAAEALAEFSVSMLVSCLESSTGVASEEKAELVTDEGESIDSS